MAYGPPVKALPPHVPKAGGLPQGFCDLAACIGQAGTSMDVWDVLCLVEPRAKRGSKAALEEHIAGPFHIVALQEGGS